MDEILLVDDDPFVAEMLAVILDAEGYSVETAEGGEEALEKLATMPDLKLLVTDLNMPGMSGVELIREAQARRPGLAAVLLTGTENPAEADELVGKGMAHYLLKDENLQDGIAEAVERALAARK